MADFTRMGIPDHYIGLAVDTKPTGVAVGSKCLEYDTDKWFFTYDGTNWVQVDALVKLLANSGVDIGDVDILSIATGSAVIGRVGHDITGIGHGVETCDSAGTHQSIVTSSTPAKRVNVQAQTDNTSAVAVGATGVDATVATGTGILLYAGDWTGWMNVDDLDEVFFDALVTGEGVRFIYET